MELAPSTSQANALAQTLDQFTSCFNAVSKIGFSQKIFNGVSLHRETYYPLRAEFPRLPAQLICSARVKATETVKSALNLQKKGLKVSCPMGRHVPIRYDARTYRFLRDKGRVSLASISGRQIIPFKPNKHAVRWLAKAEGFDSADLVSRKGRFFLHIVLTIADVPFTSNGKVVGVDLGLNRPAVTSNKQFLGKKQWKEVDHRYFRLKRRLQAKGTRSAKRHLRRLSGRVQRFRRDCDHVLSRHIVQALETGTTIVVENLVDIRRTTKQRGRESRRRMHSWSFAQLRGFLKYKAEDFGCQVVGVDPRHTSQMCSCCGYTHRSNRRSQSVFKCRSCGYELNADLNASINIAQKYLVGSGIPAADGLLSTSPLSRPTPEGVGRDKLPALAGSS